MLFDLVNVGKLYKERDGSFFLSHFPISNVSFEPTDQ